MVLPHSARYYRGAVLPQMERYYRPTILPGHSTGPTTAPNRGFCGSRSGSSHGTTARRYYRSTGRYYRPTVLPGRTTEPTTAPNRGFCGSRRVSSHGTTAGRYYLSTGGTTAQAKKQPGQNKHNFSIRTPILMILGLF